MKCRWFFISLLLLAITSCAPEKEPVYQQQSYVFGTLVEITVYGLPEESARIAQAAVLREFDRLHAKLHAWKPSELSRLNEALAKGVETTLDDELLTLLKGATLLEERSGHLFNPAIGQLIRLWGFQSDDFAPQQPEAGIIAQLVSSGPQLSQLVFRNNRISTSNPQVQIDLGGYAKGYALDVAARLLREHGVKHALINVGGNVLALGKRGERPWRVGIRHPRESGPLAALDLHDGEAIGTSGDYQRFFMQDGKRYCHLIDPRTGFPVQGVQAVTIVTRGGLLSDAGSKPLFVAGVTHWRQAARDLGIDQAMLIDQGGVVHITPALKQRITFMGKPPAMNETP